MTPTPGPTYANFSRLEKGMSQEQVEQLLGKPNGNDGDLMMERLIFVLETPDSNPEPAMLLFWRSHNEDQSIVGCDRDSQLMHSLWNGIRDERRDFEKLRDRLPWIANKSPQMVFKINLNTVIGLKHAPSLKRCVGKNSFEHLWKVINLIPFVYRPGRRASEPVLLSWVRNGNRNASTRKCQIVVPWALEASPRDMNFVENLCP